MTDYRIKELMYKSKTGGHIGRDDLNFLEAAYMGDPKKYAKLEKKVHDRVMKEMRGC